MKNYFFTKGNGIKKNILRVSLSTLGQYRQQEIRMMALLSERT